MGVSVASILRFFCSVGSDKDQLAERKQGLSPVSWLRCGTCRAVLHPPKARKHRRNWNGCLGCEAEIEIFGNFKICSRAKVSQFVFLLHAFGVFFASCKNNN